VILGKGNEVTIGDRIRRIRKKRRLTQAELAMMSGLSLSAIQGYEQGRYEPKRKSLESIAEVFKIPVDELYDMPAQLSTNLAEVGMDCISRQDALEAFGLSEKTRKYGGDHSGYDTMMMYEIQDTIENLPPIQPDIVRCKDCKHWIPYDWMFSEVWRSKNIADYPEDEIDCEWSEMSMKANDFCSRAERREDG
jgi:transcriptional regulator with XRE-family HTH domain